MTAKDSTNCNSLVVRRSTLRGTVQISGAKNSALKLQTASILTSRPVVIDNYPAQLLDTRLHEQMLVALGKECHTEGQSLYISEPSSISTTLDWNDRSIRNTLLMLGCLTTRFGSGRVPLPGGCKLGERKYDLHVMILEKMGARVFEDGNFLCTQAKNGLTGCEIDLPMRSTGATENAIMCGCLARGTTVIRNPHIRPEIQDLVSMLCAMGADITIRGQESITVHGQQELLGVRHATIPDNMEALTWLIGSVMTRGDVEIIGFPFQHLKVPLEFLRESGARFYRSDERLIVRGGECLPIEISTGPYPGINSDMQPLFAAYGAMAHGISRIVDLRFVNRYGYSEEMTKIGIDTTVEHNRLEIRGGRQPTGGAVRALDLRAGVALALLGLCAESELLIHDAWQIARGYDSFVDKCIDLGAAVELRDV